MRFCSHSPLRVSAGSKLTSAIRPSLSEPQLASPSHAANRLSVPPILYLSQNRHMILAVFLRALRACRIEKYCSGYSFPVCTNAFNLNDTSHSSFTKRLSCHRSSSRPWRGVESRTALSELPFDIGISFSCGQRRVFSGRRPRGCGTVRRLVRHPVSPPQIPVSTVKDARYQSLIRMPSSAALACKPIYIAIRQTYVNAPVLAQRRARGSAESGNLRLAFAYRGPLAPFKGLQKLLLFSIKVRAVHVTAPMYFCVAFRLGIWS